MSKPTEIIEDAEVIDALPEAVMHENVTQSLVALPMSSDFNDWTDEEKALADAAGLVKRVRGKAPEIAPRATIAAFLHQCHRTGLDPIARQIYAIERGGKWQTQISIDGFRLIAQRSGEYRGQTPVQWTGDGREWLDVWLFDEAPRAARVGVYRDGFIEPLMAVARWDSYAPMVPKWSDGRKVGEELSPMWQKMPDLMLGKVAEMLALRRAFPQELAGLYGTEEMAQANVPGSSPRAVAQREIATKASDDRANEAWLQWKALIDGAETVAALNAVAETAQTIQGLVIPGDQEGRTVQDYISARYLALVPVAAETIVADEATGEVLDEPAPSTSENIKSFKAAQTKVQRSNARARLQAGLNTTTES